MLRARQKAVALTTAPRQQDQILLYKQAEFESRIKLQIGEVLVFLQNPFLGQQERRQGWQLFETSLRRYTALRFSGAQQ